MPMDSSSCVVTNAPIMQESLKPKMTSGRKSSKPLMEKRRRARINDSICQLKSLILEATNKDTSRHSKLERADILEMTVRHLRNLQRQQISSGAVSNNNSSSAEFNRYRLGYSECISEVSRYLDTSESAVQLRTQLIGHLANRCSPPPSPGSQQPPAAVAFTPARSPSPTIATAAMSTTTHHIQSPIASSPSLAVPSSAAFTSGEIRVVLPSEALRGGQLPSHFIPVYAHGAAPSLSSPTSSTSSMDTSPSPPIQHVYNPAATSSLHHQMQQESTSPVSSYESQQQTVPISYMLGVAPNTTSPLVGSIAPQTSAGQPMHHASSARVITFLADGQMQTRVASPESNVPAAVAAQTNQHEMQDQHEFMAQQQHRVYYQSSPQNALRTVNINVQQQHAVASADENVWRPW